MLPFVNMSSDKDNEYLSDGITEDILNALAKVPGLRVPARTSAFALKGKNEDIRKVGELLHVGTVLEGSVQRAGERLRITAQLINVADGFHLWSEQFDREMKDVFAIQDEITRAIVAKLQATLTGTPGESPLKRRPLNVQAFQHYLKGRFHTGHYTEESLKQAIGEFQEAVKKQPDYAQAYAGLAYAYGAVLYFGHESPEKIMPQLKAAGSKALELDDSLVEPYLLRGYHSFFMEWDWKTAEQTFQRALELDSANPEAHGAYSDFLLAMGRFEEALAENTIAQTLDPLSTALKLKKGWILFHAREFDRAIEVAQKVSAAEADYFAGHELMGFALFEKGQREEGIKEMETAIRLGAGPLELARLGRMYGIAGKKAEAQGVLQQLQDQAKGKYMAAYCLADIYEGLGDFEQANVWMNKAIEERSSPLVYLKVGADSANRANPHFPEWLKKVGFNK